MKRKYQGWIIVFFCFSLLGRLYSQRPDLGINLTWPTDWSQDHVFADIVKTSRGWTYLGTDSALSAADRDSERWPLTDATLFLWANRNMQGTYRLSLTGTADITIDGGGTGTSLSNVVYDPAANRTTAQITILSHDVENFWINFSNTNGGVRNVKLMRPLFPGSTESYPESTAFTDAFKQAVAPFSTLRVMQFTGTNFSQQKTWADRRKPGDYTYNDESIDGGVLASWECVINLANELQKDIWIDIPLWADAEYSRQCALLFRDGNSYTNNRGLDPNLKLYVELSNEIWNYEQNENRAAALDEILNHGDPDHLNYDGLTQAQADDGWQWGWRRPGAGIVKISNIFRNVFGDAQMMTHIRPVLCWQMVRHSTAWAPLEYIEKTQPNPVNYYIYGGGGSAYYSPANILGVTLDNIWENGNMNLEWWRDTWPDEVGKGSMMFNAYICNLYGIKRVAYEGGPSFDPTGSAAQDTIMAQAWRDERIRNEIIEHHNAWNNWNGDLLCYYVLTQNYMWGFIEHTFNLNSPKYQGILDLNSSPLAPVTIGNPVGTVLDGNAYRLGRGDWQDVPGSGHAWRHRGSWVSYMYTIPAEGYYEAAATITTYRQLDTLHWWANGKPAAVSVLTNFQDETRSVGPILFYFTPGVHTIRVNANVEGWILDSISLVPSQNTCAYLVSPLNQNFEAHRDSGSIQVSCGTGCAWTAASTVSWIRITGGSAGAGTGVIRYSIDANTGNAREGIIMAAGQVYTVHQSPGLPDRSFLYQNYPNPFNPKTMIRYAISSPSQVHLRIYDILGREITTLVQETKPAGEYSVEWNGKNTTGRDASSGIYFYQLKTNNGFTETKRMLFIK